MKDHLSKFLTSSLLLCFLAVTQLSATDLATLRPKGNATVPSDAPIQPPQAFVDNALALKSFDGLTLSNKGITYFSGTLLYDGSIGYYPVADSFGSRDVLLDGNALSAASVNSILAAAALYESDYAPGDGALDLSGGTNAAPTGQGLTDKATLISAGWTVTTN